MIALTIKDVDNNDNYVFGATSEMLKSGWPRPWANSRGATAVYRNVEAGYGFTWQLKLWPEVRCRGRQRMYIVVEAPRQCVRFRICIISVRRVQWSGFDRRPAAIGLLGSAHSCRWDCFRGRLSAPRVRDLLRNDWDRKYLAIIDTLEIFSSLLFY